MNDTFSNTEKIVSNLISKITSVTILESDLGVDLMESGILDSMKFVEMIIELEELFSIDLNSQEIFSNSFKTIKIISSNIDSLKISK